MKAQQQQVRDLCRFDALHLSLSALGGDSRFARFPIGNHPRKARPAFDVQCRVVIAMRLESTILTPVFSHRQCFAHSVTTSRAILRRVVRIHLDHPTTSLFRFARQYPDEVLTSRVPAALGEMMILYHPFDVQIFDGDRVELAHDFERRLVMKIGALASDLLMLPGEKSNRLVSAIAHLVRTARDSALSSLQFA